MALKFDVSVVKTVVGARREALDLFLGFREAPAGDDEVAGRVGITAGPTVVSGAGEGLNMGRLFGSGLGELAQVEESMKKSESGSNSGRGWRREERELGAAARDEYSSSPPLEELRLPL